MHIMKEKKPPKNAASSKTSKIRTLKDEDLAIWGQATENVTKFSAPNLNKDDTPKRLKRHYSKNIGHAISGTITLETFGAHAPASKTITHQSSSFQVDTNLKKKFEKGDLPIEGKIDLHGMTLAQAHHRFVQFITGKIKEGARFILVVTGKGSGDSTGVIRKNLPLWCDDKNLKPYILQFKEAQPKHGGSGASYILLRRQK
jgi:DNA-nicking Smr family endonuclease